MKKKLLSIVFLVAAICLSVSIGMGFTYASAAEGTNVEVEIFSAQYYENVNKTIDVYEQAMAPYLTRSIKNGMKEVVEYGDDFAGVFIDERGFLNIGVTSSDSQVRSLNSSHNYGGQVLYKNYKHSYKYLLELFDEIALIMPDYNILKVATDEELNKVGQGDGGVDRE